MSSNAIRKMLFGEKMPDKDDPKYKERYQSEVAAGRKFAQKVGIDKAASRIQRFATDHKRLFLGIVFGFILFCFSLNVYRLFKVYDLRQDGATATQRQEQMLKQRRERVGRELEKKHEPTIKQQNNGNIQKD